METREELLNGLNDAEAVIKQLANVQQRLTQVRSQYKATISHKQKGKLAKFILIMFALNVVLQVINFNGWALVFAIIYAGVAYFVMKYYYKWSNQKIDSQNEQIAVHNGNIKGQEQAVINELQQIQVAYRERISWWYPENYCSVDAVTFFNSAVRNRRADNIKEAINLYETTLHQRRVEDNQQQALKQQKLNNLLSAGSLVMQGMALGEQSRHNATAEFEMQNANRTLRDINSKLRR